MDFLQILMTAATQGGGAAATPAVAAWPSLIGANQILDPGCADPTKWNEGAGVTVNVTPGKMVATAASSTTTNDGMLSGTTIAGATYRPLFTADSLSGTARVTVGGTAGTARTLAGTYSQDIVAADDTGWQITFTAATGIFDTFSCVSVGLLGVEADWSLGGLVVWETSNPVGPNFQEDASDSAALTGSAAVALDAAVSNNTACSVTLTTGIGGMGGSLDVSLKGGTPVTFSFSFGAFEEVTHTVSSGTGSGFLADSNNGDPAAGTFIRVQITPA